jgi:hypothetical protein
MTRATADNPIYDEKETALTVLPDDAPVPVFSGPQMAQALLAYRDLQAALDRAMPEAIIEVKGKRFRKKSYWRAVAVAFKLDVQTIDERREVDGLFEDGHENFGYVITCRATAPSGRTVTGDGACFAVDKARKSDTNPWRALPVEASVHNVRGHANTRAYNRAVSNLVGFGEVSADELSDDDGDDRPVRPARAPDPVQPEIPSERPRSSHTGPCITEPQARRLFAIAHAHGWKNDKEVESWLKSRGYQSATEIPRSAYDAIIEEVSQAR